MLDQMRMDTADGVGPVSVAGEHGAAGLGAYSRPDSTPPTGGGVGRLSGVVPVASGRDPIDAAFPADREHGGIVRIHTVGDLEISQSRFKGELRKPPASLPRNQANQDVLDGWVSLLSPHFDGTAAVNLTGTYRDDYGYSHGLMLPRNVIRDFIAALHHERPDTFLPWCLGVERHNTGRDVLHFHAMIGGEWSQADCEQLRWFWGYSRGWAVAKPVSDAGGCVGYCAKHLLKRGAADNFDFQLVPQRRIPSRHDKRVCESAR